MVWIPTGSMPASHTTWVTKVRSVLPDEFRGCTSCSFANGKNVLIKKRCWRKAKELSFGIRLTRVLSVLSGEIRCCTSCSFDNGKNVLIYKRCWPKAKSLALKTVVLDTLAFSRY